MLRQAYPDAVEELETGLQRVDFYIPEHNLCIEIDGSFHFYGLTMHELSKSKLKYKLMEQAGLKIVRLRHYEFKKPSLGLEKEAVLAYVEAAIEEKKDQVAEKPHDVYYKLLTQEQQQ